MGKLYIDRIGTQVAAVFENGVVYAGDTTWGRVLGYYQSGEIVDTSRRIVAKYRAGTAYALDTIGASGAALCCCSGAEICGGGSGWNQTLGGFSGDCEGACAAAVLYFGLYEDRYEGTRSDVGGVYVPQTGGNSFAWASVIITIICAVGTWVFWCTETGREMLLGRPEGLLTVLACVFSAILGTVKIKNCEDMGKWLERVKSAVVFYGIALICSWIVCMVSGVILGDMSLGYFFLSFFVVPILTICAAAPIFLIQSILLIFIRPAN